jgi:hypothetical protein
MTAPAVESPRDTTALLQSRFLALLPKLERHGRICFRHLRCLHQRAEAQAEMVALAWHWFVRLARRDKNPEAFVTVLASFAARAVASGRRLCGQEAAKDVLSPLAQRRHGFAVQKLHPYSASLRSPWEEAVRDNTQTPVPEQVVFRVDFPAWRGIQTERNRQIIDQLLMGEPTGSVARIFDLSPGRVAQLRREFHDDWLQFGATPEEDESPTVLR